MMNTKTIVTRNEWLARRKELLDEEKRFTRLRDELAAKRRALPWVEVDARYVFHTETGERTLPELFAGRGQLAVYHFMFDPEWEAGCKSCTFWADSFDHLGAHLAHRDVTFLAISRAPLAKLLAYKKRMGWTFDWVSSFESEFNHDFGVTFTPAELATGTIGYNYGKHKAYTAEMPGISVFARDGDEVFHTYSAYARGIDMVNPAYQWLDLVPRGRDEGEGQAMAWLRRRDEYVD